MTSDLERLQRAVREGGVPIRLGGVDNMRVIAPPAQLPAIREAVSSLNALYGDHWRIAYPRWRQEGGAVVRGQQYVVNICFGYKWRRYANARTPWEAVLRAAAK